MLFILGAQRVLLSPGFAGNLIPDEDLYLISLHCSFSRPRGILCERGLQDIPDVTVDGRKQQGFLPRPSEPENVFICNSH